jgi:hypothetical protein
MEAPQKIVLPGEVHPVRNSSLYDSKPSGALNPARIIIKPDSAAQQRGIISNGVNIISDCALDSAPCRPFRRVGVLDYKIQSGAMV